MITLQKQTEHSVILTTGETITDSDFAQILKLLDSLIKSSKQFALIVDATATEHVTLSQSLALIKWMKQARPFISNTMLGSVILIKASKIAEILNKVFHIQKPVKPNLITSDLQKGHNFINEILKEYRQEHKHEHSHEHKQEHKHEKNDHEKNDHEKNDHEKNDHEKNDREKDEHKHENKNK